jgi:hypothetical protein
MGMSRGSKLLAIPTPALDVLNGRGERAPFT